MTITVGVLALQGAFLEHLVLLRQAYQHRRTQNEVEDFKFAEVRNVEELSGCDALIIPGGESTTISLVAAESNLLDPLRNFVK
jgi:pyridoxal 5'-phosphate synthase pdxT subunit